ncbi:MAG TPA: penicillin-binding transpeptidase domain-containing protein [Candidatus Methylacidiphilales bacterium]|nr:penicillin-binding transpeptidase domain-containing protein [Candidatus Methylacidiphilales bacterium]
MAKDIPAKITPSGEKPTLSNGGNENGQVTTMPPPRRSNKPRLNRISSGPPAPVKKKRTFWRKVWLVTQICLVVFIIASAIIGYIIYEKALVYYARAETYDLKKLDDLNVTSTFLDVNGEELGRIFVEDRILLKPDQIPDTMRKAAMAAEDRRFYEHGAIDYWGILRALHQNFSRNGRVQGGSTIEQQLAKHLIGDFSRTLDRKFLEAFVAMRLEKAFTKDQIMNYYLNRIYFGKGYFGVGAAARGYFGKDASQLTLPECALLAGIIRAPTSSSPRTNLWKAKLNRDNTLKQMFEEGYITHEQYSHALNTPIRIQPAKPSGLQSFEMAAAVKEMEQILSIEGTEEMPQGLTVHTNINLRLQRAIEDRLNLKLAQIEAAAPQPTANPGGASRSPLQGSAIVTDISTGRVLAWVGGRDFSKNQFDHISMAHRENGALLQPILYALAFDRLGLNPASMINASYIDPTASASPADLALGNPLVDLTKRFLSVQDALALGSTPAATRVGLQLGAGNVGQWLQNAGLDQVHIPDDKPNVFNPSPMTLGDIISLYQILGDGGTPRKLKIIQSIESRTGQVLYDDTKPDANESDLLNKLNDRQINLTLKNAVRSGFARTLTRDYGLKSEIAGMPGYSEGYRDAWFVGYTPKILAGVWVGYDDSRPIGNKDVAIHSAVPLWGQVMQEVEARMPTGGQFPVPPALSKVEIDRSTGALRGLAGLAPAPDDIFVYLKKEQVDAAATQTASSPSIQAPREWSDWLTTMFNEADETGLAPDQIMMSEDKRANIIPTLAEYKMPGLRGDILSSDGVVFATMGSEKNLVLGWPATDEAAADADIVRWMRARLDELQQVIGITVTVSDKDLLAEYKTQRYQPFTVLENVTPDQASKIQSAGLENKGFGFQTIPMRNYPHGPELAHVLGHLSRDQQRNRGKYLSGDVIYDRYKGASGIEAVMNQELTGKDGAFMISTTPDGYARSAAVSQPATYGDNVRLSIDSKIQRAVEDAMSNSPKKMKAVVMLDIHTGDVVAMASQPTFDPNLFVPNISADEWKLLNSDELAPLLNRTIQAQYPPGSSFKIVTSIAAMKAGVFDPNWVVHCTGYFDLDNSHRMNLPEEKGDVTYFDALTYSYNTYFATLGEKIGRDVLLDTARSLNLGNLTGIDLPDELPGLMPDPEFVKRVHQREFGYGDIALTSIGQGDVLVTPLQMADVMAAIANNGTVYRPRLIKDIEDRNGNVIKDYPVQVLRSVTFDDKWMPTLKAAMINVIDAGTASAVHRSDMKIAAKTGTAQVGSKDHRRQIAWLSGYLPADNPQYSFSIMVEGQFSDNRDNTLTGGLLGGVDAGAIAKDMFASIYPPPGKKSKESETASADATGSPTDTASTADDSNMPVAQPATETPPTAESPNPSAQPTTAEARAAAPPTGEGAGATPP